MITFDEFMTAFLFVSSERYGLNTAIFCRETGQIYYRSAYAGIDEIGEEDVDEYTCVEIPHQNDLGLGRDLVFEFVEAHLPGDYDRVSQISARRGAYKLFKDFLESKGLLERWYDFENQREELAVRQWCLENEIEFPEET